MLYRILQDQTLFKRHDFETSYFFKLITGQLHFRHGSKCFYQFPKHYTEQLRFSSVQFGAFVNYNINGSHGYVFKILKHNVEKEENASLLLISPFSTVLLKTLILT